MEKTVQTLDHEGNEVDVRFRSTGAVPLFYRLKFHRDMMQDMAKLRKSQSRIKVAEKKLEDGEITQDDYEQARYEVADLEIFEKVAYIMAWHADNTIPDTLVDWLEGFSMFSITEILPTIIELWNLNEERMSVPKKNKGKRKGK